MIHFKAHRKIIQEVPASATGVKVGVGVTFNADVGGGGKCDVIRRRFSSGFSSNSSSSLENSGVGVGERVGVAHQSVGGT